MTTISSTSSCGQQYFPDDNDDRDRMRKIKSVYMYIKKTLKKNI